MTDLEIIIDEYNKAIKPLIKPTKLEQEIQKMTDDTDTYNIMEFINTIDNNNEAYHKNLDDIAQLLIFPTMLLTTPGKYQNSRNTKEDVRKLGFRMLTSVYKLYEKKIKMKDEIKQQQNYIIEETGFIATNIHKTRKK